MAKRLNPLAPYFVQMRELERRLIRSALDQADQQLQMAAEVLGVHRTYLRVRGRVLGGIFAGEPKHEPPTATATEIWIEENGKSERTTSPASKAKGRKPKLEIVKDDEPELEPDA